jgi:hypothetical protein
MIARSRQHILDVLLEASPQTLPAVAVADARRRVVVIDPLEKMFAQDDPAVRETLFAWLAARVAATEQSQLRTWRHVAAHVVRCSMCDIKPLVSDYISGVILRRR